MTSIVLLDPENRVIYASNSFLQLIQGGDPSAVASANAASIADRPVFDLLKDQNLKDLFSEVLTKDSSREITREIEVDGQQRFFEIAAFELTDTVKGRLVNITDLTPVVMEAKSEAEAASRSKSAFLATMSHEIRTPLNAIIGLSGIEMQKKLPEETRTNLEKIHDSGAGLLAIISDILDISKIEVGNFELIEADYDVPSLINDTVQLNIVRIGSDKIKFKLKIDETLPVKLFGDLLRVKQILNNLLSNAFKYTKEGVVSLTINWEAQGAAALVAFTIRDTGCGIKQEDISRLFSEYRQINNEANRQAEGTGLGLAIAKNLATLMNGDISVESEYGTGSVFTVRIPQIITDSTPLGEATTRNLESLSFKEVNQSQALRLVRSYMPYGSVLVVDDVETNLDVARGLLLPYGIFVDTAPGGREAVEKVRAAGEPDNPLRYDLVLMDHMMPGMDGIEAVRVIRNEIPGDYGKTLPIIALTANALVGNREMFLENGFNGFISKPIDVMQLDTALNMWIRNKQNAETLRQAETESAGVERGKDDTPSVLDGIQVEGIDLIQGRERYSGEKAYLEILRSWHLHTPALLEILRGLSLETLPEYTVTVHGLKGSSYGIFATGIGDKAEELEQSAKAGDFAHVQSENPAFLESVERLLQAVGELLQKVASGKKAKQKVPAPDAALLAGLLDAVKRYKSTLMDEVMAELESYEYESGGDLVEWLRGQIDNLEYEAICEKLEGGS